MPLPFNALIATTGAPSAIAAGLERSDVYFVARASDRVHHVERDYYGDIRLEHLRSQIQIALEVGRVDYVYNKIGTLVYHVVTRHDLLGRVRRKRVYAGKIDYLYALGRLPLEPAVHAFALFHGNARPIAYVRRAARQAVEQSRFAAIRIAYPSNFIAFT